MQELTAKHILIVEDQIDLASLIQDYLMASDYTSEIISRGGQVLQYIQNHHVDLLLLDVQLPEINGFELCKQIRETSDLPIIFITARVEEVDRLLGLELGGDDYLCKPFSPKELIARIKTILRRISIQSHHVAAEETKGIILDEDRLILSIFSSKIELTKTEANLFKLLFDSPGKIFSREKILDSIYSDYRVVSNRTVDSHIKKLRKKIYEAYPKKELILSIYGVGYKFEPPTDG